MKNPIPAMNSKTGNQEAKLTTDSIEDLELNSYAIVYQAAINMDIENLNKLITKKELQDKLNFENNFLLRWAVKNQQMAILNQLLTMENVLEKADVENNLVIRRLAKLKHIDGITKLLSLDKVRSQAHVHRNFLLHFAISIGDLDLIQDLLSIKDVAKKAATKNNYALYLAIMGGNLKIVETLLEVKTVRDLAYVHDNQLLELSQTKHPAIAAHLLAINTVHRIAELNDAARAGNLRKVQALLKKPGVEKAISIKLLMLLASHKDSLDLIKQILSYNKIKNQVSLANNLPLLRAVYANNIDLAHELFLIKKIQKKAENMAEVLPIAIKAGDIHFVRTLLQHQPTCDQAHYNNNQALSAAVKYGNSKLVEMLLSLKNVRKHAAYKKNFLLQIAMDNGHLDIVKILLEQRTVQNTIRNDSFLYQNAVLNRPDQLYALLSCKKIQSFANFKHNNLLHWTIEMEYTPLFNLLINIENVRNSAADLDNYLLNTAAQRGSLNAVKSLLGIENVRDTAHVKNNRALKSAIKHNHIEIVQELLFLENIKRKVSNDDSVLSLACKHSDLPIVHLILSLPQVITNLSAETVVDSLNSLDSINLDLSNLLIHALGHPSMLELFFQNKDEYLWKLRSHLSQPILLNNPYGLAKTILASHNNYLVTQAEENTYSVEANSESSMEDSLLSTINETFITMIQPAFQSQFEELGPNLNTRLDEAEKYIKWLILNKIKTVAEENKDIASLSFIQENKQAILSDESMAKRASQLFRSNTDPAHIAWRCYDRFIDYPSSHNFFIPPQKSLDANEPIFTTSSSSPHALSLNQACNLIRERAAYYALVMVNEPNELTRKMMENDFIFYLAEINRAHAESSHQSDAQSCFPGVLSRLGLSIMKSPQYGLKWTTKKQVLTTLLSESVAKGFTATLNHESELFQSAFQECSENKREWAEKLLDATFGIGIDNAMSILLDDDAKTNRGFTIERYTSAHAKIRESLLWHIVNPSNKKEEAASLEDFFFYLEQKMQETNQNWFLSSFDRAYILLFVTALSEPSLRQGLGDLYVQTFFPGAKKTEIASPLSTFEHQLRTIDYLLNNHPANAAILEKRRLKIERQQQLLLKFEGSSFHSSYSPAELIQAVEELTSIPEEHQLAVLQLWHKQKNDSPCFFSASLWKPNLQFTAKTKKELQPYIENLKPSILLSKQLEAIINIIIDLQLTEQNDKNSFVAVPLSPTYT